MAKTKVWVLAALFMNKTTNETTMDVISVHSDLDEAIEAKGKCFEETKKNWLDKGMKEDEMLEITGFWFSVLKARDNSKQVEFDIFKNELKFFDYGC